MITIDGAVLAKALKHAAGVVEGRNTIPILANVRIVASLADGGEGRLMLTTSDMDVQFEQSLPAQVETALATTVDARRLADIAGAVAPGAQIALALEDGRLRVKAARARWLLPVLPVDDFPELAAQAFEHAVELPGKRLGEAFAKIGPAISTEVTRPYLGGILWHGEQGKSAGVATDGHRMVCAVFAEIDHPADAPEVILGRKFVRLTQSLVGDLAGAVTLRWTDRLARIELGEIVLTAKVIDGVFPDYRRIMPMDEVAKGVPVVFTPESMSAALRRIRTATSEKTRCVKLERQDGALKLSLTSPEYGTAAEDIPAESTAGFEAGFNSAYLLDMMAAIGGDSVEMHHADGGAVALFRRVVPDGVTGVLMPMRV